MSAGLLKHIATADEPIPEFVDCRLYDVTLPDMRAVPPIAQMIEWLTALDGDPSAYVRLWRTLISSTGNGVSVRITLGDEWHLMVDGPIDSQIRHRFRWAHFLTEDLDRQEGRRAVLMELLIDDGRYIDERRLHAKTEG